MHKPTIFSVSRMTAMVTFILIGSLFCLAGCTQLYKLLGLTDQQTADQVAQDQAAIAKITQDVRFTTTEILTTALAGIGAIATGFLAKWLGTEKKINKAIITGVEDAHASDVKASIKRNATAAGVESKLNIRVRALT